MISKKLLNELSQIETNSWAVWDPNKINNLSFFESKINLLHGRVIFTGLNPSNKSKVPKKIDPFKNFHSLNHVGDCRLRIIIQDGKLSNLIGGLMTDLSSHKESDSNKVNIDNNKVENFIKNVCVLKSKNRVIICFGNKVFESFQKALHSNKKIDDKPKFKIKSFSTQINGEKWIFYRVWHYSNWGIYKYKAEKELPEQLKFINQMNEKQNIDDAIKSF